MPADRVRAPAPSFSLRSVRAFTRVELATIAGSLALLATVVLPAVATSRARDHQLVCFNNLRQVGQALLTWAGDHGDHIPPMVLSSEGGTRQATLSANAWYHFAWISNELQTPKGLLCPADTGRQARDFSSDPNGGLLHPAYRNNAVSYTLGHPLAEYPTDWLSTDRHLRYEALNQSCSYYPVAASIYLRPTQTLRVAWTNSIHVNSGNVLTRDGRVEPLSNAQLAASGIQVVEDNSILHLLVPR